MRQAALTYENSLDALYFVCELSVPNSFRLYLPLCYIFTQSQRLTARSRSRTLCKALVLANAPS